MGTLRPMQIETLDHVALWVADRDRLADFLVAHAGMHVIDRTERFTLVGSDARRGKLTLFAAEGRATPACSPGRPAGLRPGGGARRAPARPSRSARSERARPSSTPARASGWPSSRWTRASPTTSTTSSSAFPTRRRPSRSSPSSASTSRTDAFAPATPGSSSSRATPGESERPLLNHLGLRVKSADEHIEEAERRGLEIADVVDAPNTYAVFLWGPDRIKLEYVEHKPTFSLT